jgi:TPR repeat protein
MRKQKLVGWALAAALTTAAIPALAQQDDIPILRPKNQTTKPASATLLVTCDLTCNWKLDGEARGKIESGESATALVSRGQHLVIAATLDGFDTVEKKLDIEANKPILVRIDLVPVHNARINGEQSPNLKPQEPPSNIEITGTYSGVVHNLTGKLSSDFSISLRENKDDSIEGCMAVKPPLGGSGYLKGHVEGTQFSFDVVGALSQITFNGKREANDLSGTYVVLFPEGTRENGEFVLHRILSKVSSIEFNSLTCPNDAAIMTQAAEQGNVAAQAYLGSMYYWGRGVSQDYAQARTLFQKSCDGGEMNGCIGLGGLYYFGHGVAQDYAQARTLFQKVCDAGNMDGCTFLGNQYYRGQGLTQDYGQARTFYQKACDGGYLVGCNNLGNLYYMGQGVTQDYGQARTFYQKACDAGNMDGCARLGGLYHFGHGVAQDYAQARTLYQKACDAGNMDGCTSLGDLYYRGQGVTQDYGQARTLFQKACDGREMYSCNMLGMLYQNGQGVTRDSVLARSFYQKACNGGVEMACTNLRNLP